MFFFTCAGLSVVGHDNIPMSRYFTPPLTTVDTFAFGQGKEMVLALSRKIDGGENERIELKSQMVLHKSLVSPRK